MRIREVRTPTAFGGTITLSHAVDQWFTPPPDLEPEIRRTLAAIFDDLPYISRDEPEMVTVFLDGIEEPLRRLWDELGLGLYALEETLAQPPLEGATGPQMRWPHTRFIVAAPASAALTTTGVAHLLDGGCEALGPAITAGDIARAWPTPEALEQQLEGQVVWCPSCLLTRIELKASESR